MCDKSIFCFRALITLNGMLLSLQPPFSLRDCEQQGAGRRGGDMQQMSPCSSRSVPQPRGRHRPQFPPCPELHILSYCERTTLFAFIAHPSKHMASPVTFPPYQECNEQGGEAETWMINGVKKITVHVKMFAVHWPMEREKLKWESWRRISTRE